LNTDNHIYPDKTTSNHDICQHNFELNENKNSLYLMAGQS